MTKRAFIISGPESAGNRVVASLLVRAGVDGAGSTNQIYTRDHLPSTSRLALTIIHHELTAPITTLRERGYDVTVIVVFRDAVAQEASLVQRGHDDSTAAAHARIAVTYANNFKDILALNCKYRLVSYDYLVWHPLAVLGRLLADLKLPMITKGPIYWDDQPYDYIEDKNAAHYGIPAARTRINSDPPVE